MKYLIGLVVIMIGVLVLSYSEPALAKKASYKKPAKKQMAAVKNGSVSIKDYVFIPDTLKIKKGGSVAWKNNDTVAHTVTIKSGPSDFDSGEMEPGGEFTFKFTTPGKYAYYCELHSAMTGIVIVK